MPGTMKQGRQRGQAMQRMTGRISEAERRFIQDMSSRMTAPARQPKGRISEQEMRRIMEAMTSQSPLPIRGMNSQTRIDMLKNPKFRK